MGSVDFSKAAMPKKKAIDLVVACQQGLRDEFRAILDAYPDSPRWVEPVTGGDALRSLILYNRLDEEEAQLLLDRGANINHQDNGGVTALIHALECRNGARFLPLLLAAGPDLSIVDNKGRSALGLARVLPHPSLPLLERYQAECAARQCVEGTSKPLQVRKPLSWK
ncbi:MAG: ankyrin repeat domain-containing protein [Alphaproteobacteria bacterium]